MKEQLYSVDFPHETKYAEAAPIAVEYDYERVIRCPQCGERVSGGYWKRPRTVVLTKHRSPDFLYNYCDRVPFLISQNVLDACKLEGIVGITATEEIETVRFQRKAKDGSVPPRYYHIELARSKLTIDHSKSTIKYGSPSGFVCALCRQVPNTYDFFRHLEFHLEEYEGYDIFQIYELGNAVFLSSKFVKMCNKYSLTNLNYNPAQEHRHVYAAFFGESQTTSDI